MLHPYLNSFLIYDEVHCGKNDFFLAHTVPEKKRIEQFNKLLWQEFITGEPEYEKEYFPDKYIVTGHTPTGFIDKAYKGRIYIKNNHIIRVRQRYFRESLLRESLGKQ